MTEPRVYLRHVLALRRPGRRRLCLAGVTAWCQRHGISGAELAAGVPGERVLGIGDRYGLKALEVAREEATRGQ